MLAKIAGKPKIFEEKEHYKKFQNTNIVLFSFPVSIISACLNEQYKNTLLNANCATNRNNFMTHPCYVNVQGLCL